MWRVTVRCSVNRQVGCRDIYCSVARASVLGAFAPILAKAKGITIVVNLSTGQRVTRPSVRVATLVSRPHFRVRAASRSARPLARGRHCRPRQDREAIPHTQRTRRGHELTIYSPVTEEDAHASILHRRHHSEIRTRNLACSLRHLSQEIERQQPSLLASICYEERQIAFRCRASCYDKQKKYVKIKLPARDHEQTSRMYQDGV